MEKKNIKIIGSGWACASFIKHIDTSKYNISVISKNSKFVYTPLLTKSTTCDINLEQDILDVNPNIKSVHGEVSKIDFMHNKIITKNKIQDCSDYDYLILCHGAQVNTFDINGVDKYANFLKDKNDIDEIKQKIKTMGDNNNIAVIGCGPTGTELIGNLMDENKYNICAIDGVNVPLSMFLPKISDYTIDLWEKNNVNLYFDSFVQKMDKNNIYIKDKKINYDMAIWCGGLKPNYLTNIINYQLNNQCRYGIPVSSTFNVLYNKPIITHYNYIYKLLFGNLKSPEPDNVFALGDCAYSNHPPTAQVAVQQGEYLAYNFNNEFQNVKPFEFKSKGQICYIGNRKSVYQKNTFATGGTMVYYVNNFIHIYNSINTEQSKIILKNMLFGK